MPKPDTDKPNLLELEDELRLIWQRAANTRKATSQYRIDGILRRSRAELSMRDLLKFSAYLLGAFFLLFQAFAHTLAGAGRKPDIPQEPSHHE